MQVKSTHIHTIFFTNNLTAVKKNRNNTQYLYSALSLFHSTIIVISPDAVIGIPRIENR